MYSGGSLLCTTRHVNRSIEPGLRYFSDGPKISAFASAEREKRKQEREKGNECDKWNAGGADGTDGWVLLTNHVQLDED